MSSLKSVIIELPRHQIFILWKSAALTHEKYTYNTLLLFLFSLDSLVFVLEEVGNITTATAGLSKQSYWTRGLGLVF